MSARDSVPMRGLLFAVPPAPELPGRRALADTDRAALGVLMAEAYRGTVDDHGETHAWHASEAAAVFAGEAGELVRAASFVIGDAGRPLAAASVVTSYRGLPLVAYVLVVPALRGQGLGTALLQHSAAALREVGHVEWTLAVTRGNPARRLYERLGLVEDESLRDRAE